jgi:hypothetical protein
MSRLIERTLRALVLWPCQKAITHFAIRSFQAELMFEGNRKNDGANYSIKLGPCRELAWRFINSGSSNSDNGNSGKVGCLLRSARWMYNAASPKHG